MNSLIFLLFAGFLQLCYGRELDIIRAYSPCGDWTQYKDQKCFKIADKAGFQNQKDAEIICESYAEELKREYFPKLITIKSKEEQEFLHNYLFVQNKIIENVWLGLKQKDGSLDYEWNDGSDVEYDYWANQTISDDHHKCVQMESGEGHDEAGLWSKVNCQKQLIVVCERTQTWTLETMQNTFLSYKVELEKRLKQAEEKIKQADEKNKQSEEKINQSEERIRHMEDNPVPAGFIYVQLPGQPAPSSLWPKLSWNDVSATYAGLFFRVVGDSAADFNVLQEENAPRLNQVEFQSSTADTYGPISIPTDGSASQWIISGGESGSWCSLRFSLTTGEIRPKNKAVKIWQRSG